MRHYSSKLIPLENRCIFFYILYIFTVLSYWIFFCFFITYLLQVNHFQALVLRFRQVRETCKMGISRQLINNNNNLTTFLTVFICWAHTLFILPCTRNARKLMQLQELKISLRREHLSLDLAEIEEPLENLVEINKPRLPLNINLSLSLIQPSLKAVCISSTIEISLLAYHYF